MAELLRRTLGEDIEIETVVAGGLWNTVADPAQVESALLNLALNARDAMPGGGRLTVEITNAVLDDDYARLEARDVTPGQYVLLAVSEHRRGDERGDQGAGVRAVLHHQRSDARQGHRAGPLDGVWLRQTVEHGHIQIYSEPGHGHRR